MKIAKGYVQQVCAAQTPEDLLPMIQAAIELEHATIPPYLCGYFTLKVGSNTAVADIIRSVVIEEMLHMTIASNLLISLGGSPQINSAHFVPKYPGALPMGIGDDFPVRLRQCSVAQVQDTFMKIEEPEDPIDIPVELDAMAMAVEAPQFDTIGAFYTCLKQRIQAMGDGIFKPNLDRQVVATRWFPDPDEMFPITDVASAVRGIDLIIDQGEGTSTTPFDESGQPSHYYRFEEIVKGRKLVERPGQTPPYAFGGDPVVLDTANVWNMDDDPEIAKYAPGSFSRRMAQQFSYSYTMLLNALHNAFNGQPDQLDHAMGVMYELRLLSQQVLATPAVFADGSANTAQPVKMTGLSFEYQTLNL